MHYRDANESGIVTRNRSIWVRGRGDLPEIKQDIIGIKRVGIGPASTRGTRTENIITHMRP